MTGWAASPEYGQMRPVRANGNFTVRDDLARHATGLLTFPQTRASMSPMPTKTRTTVRKGATEKFLVYDSLASFNQAFAQVLQNLRTLEKLCSLQHDFFSGLQATLEETRAWANYEVLGSLHDREEINWGRFGRLRRQWEKKNEDPKI